MPSMPVGDGKPDERSQPIFRVPRDKTPAELMLDDGERNYVLLFVTPGERISQVFDDPNPFMPVIAGSATRLVSRRAIACVTLHVLHAQRNDADELPQECQRALVRLRGGLIVRGELKWTAPLDRRRTLDFLNGSETHFVVYDGAYTHYIAKTAVLSVEEI